MAALSQSDATKRRLENAFSALSTKRQRPRAPTPHSPTDLQTDKTSTGSEEIQRPASLDRFRPWSHEDLLERIATYKIHTWLTQSSRISPVRCARNGWINVDCSTLNCPMCSAILLAQIPDDLNDEEEVRWIGRLAEQLQSAHNAGCPWKGHPCASSVYSVPLATSRETVDEICQYTADILKFRGHLPATDQPLSAFERGLLRDLQHKVADVYKSTKEETVAPDNSDVDSALLLALFGWRIDKAKPQPAVKCELCFRSAGLWLFQSASDSNEGKKVLVDEESSTTRRFNVVDEHRAFCYWARGSDIESELESNDMTTDVCSTEIIPGWKKIMASILRARTMDRNSGQGLGDKPTADDGSSENEDGAGGEMYRLRAEGEEPSFQQLRPFNFSAISSAAEAFGIPFSKSLLARATKMLASNNLPSTATTAAASVSQTFGAPPATATSDNHSSLELGSGSSVLLRTTDDGQEISDHGSVHIDAESDSSDMPGGREYNSDMDNIDEDIPAPIDTSGLASLVGDSSLASALEDPTKAKAILENTCFEPKVRREPAIASPADPYPDPHPNLRHWNRDTAAVLNFRHILFSLHEGKGIPERFQCGNTITSPGDQSQKPTKRYKKSTKKPNTQTQKHSGDFNRKQTMSLNTSLRKRGLGSKSNDSNTKSVESSGKRIAVLVLGDIGRSPRMQYHALSLADAGHHVDLIGYAGARPMEDVILAERIAIRHVQVPDQLLSAPRTLFALTAPLKAIYQTLLLLWILLFSIARPDCILVQNPPAIPTLFVARLSAWLTGARLIIDWHNYGYTLLGMKLGPTHPILWERLLRDPQLVELAQTSAPASVDTCMDRQQSCKSLLTCRSADGTVIMRPDRPMLVVSSTSWTADEDFSLLLRALELYDDACISTQKGESKLPSLVMVITGKGPLREHYEAEIAQLALQAVRIVTAWLTAEDYPLLLGSADLGISLHTSSSGLDLPMKVVDMLGCGTPVCAYWFSSIGELVTETNGLVFDSPEELARQLQDLAISQRSTYNGTYWQLFEGAAAFRQQDWSSNYHLVLDLL
ncbi:mannosyltransferase [Coemansia sp. RSA 988]|nr:mannosyltransferase [Coemansia sp. RSA 988]